MQMMRSISFQSAFKFLYRICVVVFLLSSSVSWGGDPQRGGGDQHLSAEEAGERLSVFFEERLRHTEALSVEEKRDFEEIGLWLIEWAKVEAKKFQYRTRLTRSITHVLEHAWDGMLSLRNRREFRRMFLELRETLPDRGQVRILVAIWLAEKVLSPVIAYWMGWEWGPVFLSVFHPTEYAMVAFFAQNIGHTFETRSRLGDPRRFWEGLDRYWAIVRRRAASLGRHPDLQLIRFELGSRFGVLGQRLLIDILDSPLPSWVPARLSRFYDGPVLVEHPSLSVHELEAILADSALCSRLKEGSRGRIPREMRTRQRVYASLLLQAIVRDPAAALRLDVAALFRDYRSLVERDASEILRAPGAADRIADYYALLRLSRIDPTLLENRGFWDVFSGFLVTREPGGRLGPSWRWSQRQVLAGAFSELRGIIEMTGEMDLAAAMESYARRISLRIPEMSPALSEKRNQFRAYLEERGEFLSMGLVPMEASPQGSRWVTREPAQAPDFFQEADVLRNDLQSKALELRGRSESAISSLMEERGLYRDDAVRIVDDAIAVLTRRMREIEAAVIALEFQWGREEGRRSLDDFRFSLNALRIEARTRIEQPWEELNEALISRSLSEIHPEGIREELGRISGLAVDASGLGRALLGNFATNCIRALRRWSGVPHR